MVLWKGKKMIRPIDSYNPNFCSRTKLAKGVNKAARKVVNIEKSSLNGISKTPIRLAQKKVDPDSQAAISGLVSSGAAISAGWMSIL